jgi:hypothetical protein
MGMLDVINMKISAVLCMFLHLCHRFICELFYFLIK